MKRSYEVFLGGSRRGNPVKAFTSEVEAREWFVELQKQHVKAELRYYASAGLVGDLVYEGLRLVS